MNITVVEWRPWEKGALRGYLALKVQGDIVIHDCKLFEKDLRRWINLPDREYTNKKGETKYAPVVEIPDRKAERLFQEAALEALRHYTTEADGAE